MKKPELKRKTVKQEAIPIITEEQILMVELAMREKDVAMRSLMGPELMQGAVDGMKKVIMDANRLIMVQNAKNDLTEALRQVG